MIKSLLGLLVGFLIGIACRRFDIPLPGPTKIIGGLVILSITAGYMGTDFLLTKHLKIDKHNVERSIHREQRL